MTYIPDNTEYPLRGIMTDVSNPSVSSGSGSTFKAPPPLRPVSQPDLEALKGKIQTLYQQYTSAEVLEKLRKEGIDAR